MLLIERAFAKYSGYSVLHGAAVFAEPTCLTYAVTQLPWINFCMTFVWLCTLNCAAANSIGSVTHPVECKLTPPQLVDE